MNRTIITAEIGECFNGDLKQAFKLIEVAKEAGCDFAKFQILDLEHLSKDDPEYEWFSKIYLKDEDIKKLIKHCQKVGIKFLATPENKKKAKLLKSLNRKECKIASSCIIDKELIEYVADNFETVFVSTGLASLDEVRKVVGLLKNKVKNFYLLHCIAEYPTGILLKKRGLKPLAEENVHLNMMKILESEFPDIKIGYSDHTVGILAPIVAVVLGAKIIEKHVTLDRKTPIELFESGKGYLGTDHVLSLEPEELKGMVKKIRLVEKILGKWKWERSEGEKIIIKFLRKRFREEI